MKRWHFQNSHCKTLLQAKLVKWWTLKRTENTYDSKTIVLPGEHKLLVTLSNQSRSALAAKSELCRLIQSLTARIHPSHLSVTTEWPQTPRCPGSTKGSITQETTHHTADTERKGPNSEASRLPGLTCPHAPCAGTTWASFSVALCCPAPVTRAGDKADGALAEEVTLLSRGPSWRLCMDVTEVVKFR